MSSYKNELEVIANDSLTQNAEAKGNENKPNYSTDKEYFFQEMKMTDEQTERLWKFYQENVRCKDAEVISPMKSFSIEYQFSTIGTAKIAKFDDKSFWIDEEECNP